MRILVESLKRLYKRGKVPTAKLNMMVAEEKISEEEKLYIIEEE